MLVLVSLCHLGVKGKHHIVFFLMLRYKLPVKPVDNCFTGYG